MPNLPTRSDIEAAAQTVYAAMPPTPQYIWPLLNAAAGSTVWVKHENHTPIGAFKVRGGLVYLANLRRDKPAVEGVIAATRGNHGQSIAFAARANGIRAVIVVPEGNSSEKTRLCKLSVPNCSFTGTIFRPRWNTRKDWPANAGSRWYRPTPWNWRQESRPMGWNS
jgi:threonine dehydratase